MATFLLITCLCSDLLSQTKSVVTLRYIFKYFFPRACKFYILQ